MTSTTQLSLQERLLTEIRAWIGTPYEQGRRAKGLGVDCLNFIGGVAEACGILKCPAPRAYDSFFWQSGHDLIREGFAEGLGSVQSGFQVHQVDQPRAGDVLFVRTRARHCVPSHAAYVWTTAGSLEIAHASIGSRGVAIGRIPSQWVVDEIWRAEEIAA